MNSLSEDEIHILLGDVTARGGIERVSINLANALSKFHKVHIVSLYKQYDEVAFKIFDKVSVSYLSSCHEVSMYNRKKNFISGVAFDLFYLRRKKAELKKLHAHPYRIAICSDVKMALLAKLSGYKKIIAIEHFEYDVINPVLKLVRRYLYSRISAVVSQTSEDKFKYKWLKDKHHIIPNIAFMNLKEQPSNDRENIVLAVGRLTYQKGFDLLLDAWSRVEANDWKLRIIGDGEEKKSLQQIINNKKIPNVELIPFSHEIEKHYHHSKIFVLSSRYEGLGMVLIEALSYGLACISFDCPAGPKTILNKKNGVLIKEGDVRALSDALNNLIHDPLLVKRFSSLAPQSVREYSAEYITKQWEQMIESLYL